MKPVQVISYSGYKADESPRLLKLGDNLLPIEQIEDRWYSPGETFFRVLTETGSQMSGVRGGLVQALGSPEYTRKISLLMQKVDELLMEG